MTQRFIDRFLTSSLEDRFRMAVDPTNAPALIDYFGMPAYQEYVDLAQRGLAELDQQHLAGEPPVSVIVLPGIMGSTIVADSGDLYWLNKLRLDRLNKLALAADGCSDLDLRLQFAACGLLWVYDPLLTPQVWGPAELGYTTHAYDWRKSLRLGTDALRRQVLDVHASNGGRAVHLLGHSMGGLLIRATLMEHGDELWDKLGRIVFVATPHYGSPKLAAFLKFHLWIAELQMRVLGVFLKRTTFRSLWGAIGLLPAPVGVYPGTRRDGSQRWQSGDSDDQYQHPCASFDLYDALNWELLLTKKELAHLQLVLEDARAFHIALYDHHMGLDQDL
ncbi:MAG TPA: alpha/beta fold hydrolase, partial [Roseiflexaceae bacterium]|nr:alpha/beta fold hydrolase [Roseiflexaceae bacterium]